jgi:hypothetical protein
MPFPELDKYGFPANSPVSPGSLPVTQVPWQFGVRQAISTRKIRASQGQFRNISGTFGGTTVLSNGTVTNSFVENGTVANNLITGATVNTSIWQGGTINGITSEGGTLTGGIFNSGTLGTPAITGGTVNNVVFGTPNVTGGTANFATYQVAGSAGLSGSIVYVKTVSPGTTFGTVSFIGGLITAFN